MFGVIWAIASFFGWASEKKDNIIINKKNRDNAVNDYLFGKLPEENAYYIDSKGNTIDLITGEKIYKTTRLGHTVFLDGIDGNLVRDITQERINKRRESARNLGKKVGMWKDNAQLRALWYENSGHASVGPEDWDYFTNIYIHFNTGRLCYNTYIGSRDIIEKFFCNKYDLTSFHPTKDGWYIDIFTGEILDIAEQTLLGKKVCPFTYIINGQKYEDFKFLKEYIEVYNNFLKNKVFTWKKKGWEKLFKNHQFL